MRLQASFFKFILEFITVYVIFLRQANIRVSRGSIIVIPTSVIFESRYS